MEEIDIVIPWLNPTEKWFSEYKNYCENENPARIRDLNTIRPTIKSILKNLSWVRYIWLIVYDEEQIPTDWEELQNKKIKFVFHRDIVPKEFIPNFNSIVTECFAHKIEGLAENFIWANDDMIFVKPVPKEFYFKNNKPVHRVKNLSIWRDVHTNMFAEILNSTARFVEKITGKRYWASDYHMPIPITKSLATFVFEKYKNEIIKSCENSKIRKEFNIAFFSAVLTLTEVYNLCDYIQYKEIKQYAIHFDDSISKERLEGIIKNNHIVCLNDSEGLVKKAELVAQWIEELL